jgi:transposase-like protein
MKKKYSSDFKATVALAAIREEATMAELVSKYEVNRIQIQSWKREVLSRTKDIFSLRQEHSDKEKDELIQHLYTQIGQLQVEFDWLKKKTEMYRR